MSPYALNKVIGLGIPLFILCLGLLFTTSDDPQFWWVLIVITHTLAYTHFILGFWYQRNSLKRKKAVAQTKAFYLLTIVAIFFSLVFIVYEATALLAIFAVWYFIMHGTLNEHTLLKQSFPNAPEAKYFLPFVLLVTPFFLLSLTHPSFFFSPKLEFLNPPPELAVFFLNSVVPVNIISITALLFFIAYILMVPVRLMINKSYAAGLTILLIILVTIIVFYTKQPLNYIFLYFIALSYHFISWFFHFLQRFITQNPDLVAKYLWHHVLIFTPFFVVTLLLIYDIPQIQELHWFLFDGKIFLILAMIHNTTSLINEEWFANWLNKTT